MVTGCPAATRYASPGGRSWIFLDRADDGVMPKCQEMTWYCTVTVLSDREAIRLYAALVRSKQPPAK